MKTPFSSIALTMTTTMPSSPNQPKHPIPLPSIITSSTPSMRWPLRDASKSMPPMYYLSLEEMAQIRTSASSAATMISTSSTASSSNGIGSEGFAWMNNVPLAISTLFPANPTNTALTSNDFSNDFLQHYDYTVLSLALLLLTHNHTDEAHDLVTPYSWPDEIHTSFGPIRYTTSEAGVVSMATYVHSLVHRREGWHVGEFGLTGFRNADFWGNLWSKGIRKQTKQTKQTKQRGQQQKEHQHQQHGQEQEQEQEQSLKDIWKEPITNIHNAIRNLAEENAAGKEWCLNHLPELYDGDASSSDGSEWVWDPRAIHPLCMQVTQSDGQDSGESGDDLISFAEQVVEAEIKILLNHCLKKAGYECTEGDKGTIHSIDPIGTSGTTDAIDPDVALAAANKLSSAHISAFLSDGVVVLRNVLPQQNMKNQQHSNQNDEVENAIASSASAVAAGVATRLLDSPACRKVHIDCGSGARIHSDGNASLMNDEIIWILLPTSEESANSYSKIGSIFNKGNLSVGDLLAISGALVANVLNEQCFCGMDSSSDWKVYESCDDIEENVTFRNRLHGGRGETPTTVVQWSKGTVHHSSQ